VPARRPPRRDGGTPPPRSGGKPPARGTGKPPAHSTGGKPPVRGSSAPGKRTDRSARGRPGETQASHRPKKVANERTKGWGAVAKRGVGKLKPSEAGTASAAWREAAKESDARERGRMGGTAPAWEPETWIDAGPVRDEARKAVKRGDAPTRPRRATLPDDVQGEVAREAGPAWAGRVQDRLRDAAKAYERERYRDALNLLKPLAERAPGSPAIRELLGLTLYRLGRWKDAIKELEVAELLGGTIDHHPVIADCHRALGHQDDVVRLWDELRRGGAGVEVLTEGRIVLAGALADRGKVRDAIALLEQGPVNVRKPKDHHLRLWYALAALYERAGEVPRARQLFARVLDADPEFADVVDRYEALT
jgi:tetratricopeptide (TPR) repeat protein